MTEIEKQEQSEQDVGLKNPYPKDTFERLQLWVGTHDVTFIRLLRPQIGTLSAVGGHLWQELCNALRRNDITDFTKCKEFEQYVSNLTILSNDEYQSLKSDAGQWRQHQASHGIIREPGRPIDRTYSDTNARNVGKRPKRIRNIPTNEPKVSPDV